jgi:ketosteroid isomerase-like protein
MSNAERLIGVLASVFSLDEVEFDEAFVERMIAALEPITSDRVVTLMAGPDSSFVGTYPGVDGVRNAWADWLGTWATVRFEFEGMEEHGDNVFTFGRQIGTSRTGGVELVQPSAAVWKFRDGLIERIEFHLDRGRAAASAREPLSDEP